MKLGLIAVLGTTLLAGGCVTPAEQRALDDQRCRGYGFRAGTDAFARCLQEMDLDRSADRRAWQYRDWGGPYGGLGYGFRRW